ncbi:hypothetical protein SNE40_019007 [Patella caerulea]|uniref:Uncharacterized protein n=1 Tax=Patella caerulea TaxID=87958 RepID=A0AAN8J9R0_PATCE
MGFFEKPLTAKIGTVLLTISYLVCLTGTSSPSWFKIGHKTLGLWTDCEGPGEFQNCGSTNLSSKPGWFYAVLSLATIGAVCLIVANIVGFFSSNRKIPAAFGVIGGLLLLISVVIYGVKQNESIGSLYWAFYLAMIAGVLGFVGALLLIPGENKSSVPVSE